MKKVTIISHLLVATTLLVACGQTQKSAQEPKVNKVTSSTYVAPEGRQLDKFIYQIDGLEKELDTSKLEIKVTNTQVDFTTKEETVTEIEPKVQQISQEKDRLTIDIEDLPYATITDIRISDGNELLSTTKETMKEATKYVDSFKKGTFTDSQGTEITYWLYTPEKHDEAKPLVIWEHGGGEVLASSFEGANLVASQGATTWLEHDYDTMVFSVQYPENYKFGISDIPEQMQLMEAYNTAKYELIQSWISEGKVDAKRVTITGASSGGGGALRFVMQYPDLFAGGLISSAKDTIVPISEKYGLAYQLEDNSKLKITDEQYQETYAAMKEELSKFPKVVDVPLWFAQAENDQITTYYTSEMMFNILEEIGAKNNKITLYTDQEMEDAGVKKIYHGSWQLIYQDTEMLDWLMQQTK